MQDSTKTNTPYPRQNWLNAGTNFRNLTHQEENTLVELETLPNTLQPCKEIDHQSQHSLQLKMQENISSVTKPLN